MHDLEELLKTLRTSIELNEALLNTADLPTNEFLSLMNKTQQMRVDRDYVEMALFKITRLKTKYL